MRRRAAGGRPHVHREQILMRTEFQSPKRNRLKSAAAAAALLLMMAGAAAAEEPIKIGLGMSLTGPLAANGKMSLVAMQVWESDINAQGGLLGRPVKLVYYDDQSKPAEVPAIYSKLLDVDKVDLIVSGYASTQIAAAMPVAVARKKLFVSLFGTGINNEFKFDKYFAMIPNGQRANVVLAITVFLMGRSTVLASLFGLIQRWWSRCWQRFLWYG